MFCFLFFRVMYLSLPLTGLFFLADYQKKFGEDYGSCQAGISNFLTEVSGADLLFPAIG